MARRLGTTKATAISLFLPFNFYSIFSDLYWISFAFLANFSTHIIGGSSNDGGTEKDIDRRNFNKDYKANNFIFFHPTFLYFD